MKYLSSYIACSRVGGRFPPPAHFSEKHVRILIRVVLSGRLGVEFLFLVPSLTILAAVNGVFIYFCVHILFFPRTLQSTPFNVSGYIPSERKRERTAAAIRVHVHCSYNIAALQVNNANGSSAKVSSRAFFSCSREAAKKRHSDGGSFRKRFGRGVVKTAAYEIITIGVRLWRRRRRRRRTRNG